MGTVISVSIVVIILLLGIVYWTKFKKGSGAVGRRVIEGFVDSFGVIGRANWHRLPGFITIVIVFTLGMPKSSLRHFIWAGFALIVILESVRMFYYKASEWSRIRDKDWARSFVEWGNPWHEKLFQSGFLREGERGKLSTSITYALGIAIGFEIFPIEVTACGIVVLAFGDPGARRFGEAYTGIWGRLPNGKTLRGMLGFMIHGGVALFVTNIICVWSGFYPIDMSVVLGQVVGISAAAEVETFLPKRLALFENGLIIFGYAIPAWFVSSSLI